MKKIFTTLLTLFAVWAATAAPVNEQQARQIASEFFAGGTRAGSVSVELAWAGSNLKKGIMQRSSTNEAALLYIYNRNDNPGFVIVAGDDNVQPVIAFSYDQTFEIENMADGARYLLSAWCAKIADAQKGGTPSIQQKAMPSTGSVECLYSTALWDQGQPFNNETPIYQGYRSATGCVATAMSIIAYYNKWPERGVGTTPSYQHEDEWGVTRTVPANTLGRTYNYSNMLSDYRNGYNSTQGAAVAALMKDMGTSVQMDYSPSGSGAMSSDVPYALATYFGYSKNAQCIHRGNKSDAEWFNMLKTNIATYGPTFFSGDDTQAGHAFVLDGYTSGNYFHINYGWSGADNGFYWIPEIEYFNDQDAVFYLEPDKNGTSTYVDNLSLIALSSSTRNFYGLVSYASEYKTGQRFNFLLGGIYNTGMVDFNGNIRLVHCNKEGVVKSTLVSSSVTDLPAGYYTYFNTFGITLSANIETGDRIRLHYKGEYSSDWQWAKSCDAVCSDEVLLKATPEEVAKSLKISYSKSGKSLTFTSPNAIQYTVKKASGSSVLTSGAAASHTATAIDLSSFAAGEYIFEFACGGDPYRLTIKL